MTHDYIQTNFAFIVAIVFLIMFIFTNRIFDKKITTLFLCAIALTLILFFVENLSVWSSEFPTPTFLRRFTSALGYTLRPLTGLMLILIVYRSKVRGMIFLFIPAIINTLVSFSGLFSKIAFYFTEDNEFKRGPLGFTAHFTAAIYMVILLIATIRFFKEKSYHEGALIAIIEISNVVATLLESIWSYKGLLRTSIVLSLAFYYIFFQTQSTKRDYLTGALKRRYLYLDGERLKGRLKAVISLDLNNLKTINDTLGHAAGDEAITTFVDCVHKAMFHGCTLYRTGGDEFMILCSKCKLEQVETLVKQLKNKMAQTPYTCAAGIAIFDNESTFDEVCNRADAAMYQDKIQMKKAQSK